MLDAIGPFAEALERSGDLATATEAAERAARQTADLVPRVGRARPLAERSVGTPDPGATSFALCVHAVTGALIGAEGEA